MNQEDPRYEIESKEVQRLLKELGNLLKDQMPENYGFTLFIFTLGANGSLFYVSSAQRDDMIRTMLEFIKRQDKEEKKEQEYLKKKAKEN